MPTYALDDADYFEELEKKLADVSAPKAKPVQKKMIIHVSLPDQTKHTKIKILPVCHCFMRNSTSFD
jgi:hypothetical protein